MFAAAVLLLLADPSSLARAAVTDTALDFSRSLRDEVLAYSSDAEALRYGKAKPGLCAVVKEARAVAALVAPALDRRRDVIVRASLSLDDLSSLAAPTDNGKASFDRSLRRLTKALPGLFVLDDKTVRFGVDWGRLASVLPDSPDKHLLTAVSGLLKGGSPLSFEAPASGTGCTDLAGATTAVAEVAAAWPTASPCLKEALADELDAKLGSIAVAGDGCICQPKEAALASGAKLAEELKALPDIGGPRNAGGLERTLSAKDSRFGCGK